MNISFNHTWLKIPVQNDSYVKPKDVISRFKISHQTLARYAKAGKVQFRSLPGGGRLYHWKSVCELFNDISDEKAPVGCTRVCYARVSSAHQRADLERQVQFLQERSPSCRVLKDVGSGLNYERKGFKALLELVYSGGVSEIAIMHKDRLCRYGFEIIQWICDKHNVKILVQGGGEALAVDSERELADDLLSVVNFFVAKRNGRRSAKNRELRKRKARSHQPDQELPSREEDLPEKRRRVDEKRSRAT